jgi:hypothetical protein
VFSCLARSFATGHEDPDVKLDNNPKLPVHDYRNALRTAVNWLGERYLLAEPVQKRRDDSKPFFVETPRWLPGR